MSPVVTCQAESGDLAVPISQLGPGCPAEMDGNGAFKGHGWTWALQKWGYYVLRKSKKPRRFCHKRFSLCCCIWRVGSGKAEAGKLSGAFLHPESQCCSRGLGSEWDVCKWQLETEILPQPRLRWTMSSAIPSPGRLMSMPSQWARQGRLGPNQWQNCGALESGYSTVASGYITSRIRLSHCAKLCVGVEHCRVSQKVHKFSLTRNPGDTRASQAVASRLARAAQKCWLMLVEVMEVGSVEWWRLNPWLRFPIYALE